MITALLAGLGAKLAALGAAAKAGIGLGIAVTATAGVAAVVPPLATNAVNGGTGAGAAVEVEVPDVASPAPDFGAQVAADATGGASSAGAEFGLDVAGRTPAADHLPSVVPGPPTSVPPVEAPETGEQPEATGRDRARQTPAGGYIPPFVPGPPSGVTTGPPTAGPPTAGPPTGGTHPGGTGVAVANETPAGGFIPPFVKSMAR